MATRALFMLMFAAAVSTSVRADADFLARSVRARVVVEQAIEAEGGRAALEGMERLQYRAAGSAFNILQGFDPHAEADREMVAAVFTLDFKSNRFYQMIDIGIRGVNAVPSPVIFKDDKLYTPSNFEKTYTVASSTDPGATFDPASRYLSPLVVRRLLQNIKSSEWLRETTIHDRVADELEFSWDESTRCRIDVDKTDHAVVGLRLLAADSVAGDDEVVIKYEGRQLVGGIAFPCRTRSYRRGEPFLDLVIDDVKVNAALDPALFDIPSGFTEVPARTVRTEKIAPNLYEVVNLGGGIYRSQFFDAGDYVVVFEAPLSIAVSRRIIDEIHTTLGNKKIRFVVLSHFHNDHAAGVGAYVVAGTTIVTTAGNEEILTRYARAGSVLNGGTLRPELKPTFLDVTAGKLDVKNDGGRAVTVYRIPGVPHVEEMLVLYEPATQTIMDGDLYATFFPFSPAFRRFAEWLQSPEAPAVVTIAGVHHPPMAKKAFLELARG